MTSSATSALVPPEALVGGPAERFKSIVAKRVAEQERELTLSAAAHTRGRWVTDTNYLKVQEHRRAEAWRRRAPRAVARLGQFMTEPTGLEDAGSPEQSGGAGLKPSHDPANKRLMRAEQGEVTDRVQQRQLYNMVDLQTQRKSFNLDLPELGPYFIDFTTNGSTLLLCSRRGHMAAVRWKTGDLLSETQLKDLCHDGTFLVDESMMAVAQKRFVYVYNRSGEEMHVLNQMGTGISRLTFLPRHMLLAGASHQFSILSYFDVSTGQLITTKTPSVVKEPTSAMSNNRSNGIVATGGLQGVVKFWSPAVEAPLVHIKSHKGNITNINFYGPHYYLTVGGDNTVKLWDMRTLRCLDEKHYYYPITSSDISDAGLVALGGGTQIEIWAGLFSHAGRRFQHCSPYMRHQMGYAQNVEKIRFAPFEDILGIGHQRGFTSIIIPGSGEPNPDFYYANPHETEMHRKDRVVRQLLDKLPPDTIRWDASGFLKSQLRLDPKGKKAKPSNIIYDEYNTPKSDEAVEDVYNNDDEGYGAWGVDANKLKLYNEAIAAQRRRLNIKERRTRNKASSKGNAAPTGLPLYDNPKLAIGQAVGGAASATETAQQIADQVDEVLGFSEAPATKERKTKRELLIEKKMAKWDKKDSSDKVRSKQKMRQGKVMKKKKAERARAEKAEATASSAKKRKGGKDGSSKTRRKKLNLEMLEAQDEEAHKVKKTTKKAKSKPVKAIKKGKSLTSIVNSLVSDDSAIRTGRKKLGQEARAEAIQSKIKGKRKAAESLTSTTTRDAGNAALSRLFNYDERQKIKKQGREKRQRS